MDRPRAIRASRSTYCCYCKRGPLIQGLAGDRGTGMTATRDHFVPESSGGGRWVPCCQACNGLKGSLRPGAWVAFIDHNPRWWKQYRVHSQVAAWLLRHNAWRRANGWPGLHLYDFVPEGLMVSVNRRG